MVGGTLLALTFGWLLPAVGCVGAAAAAVKSVCSGDPAASVILLLAGQIVRLNFLKKSSPRIGVATAANKNWNVKWAGPNFRLNVLYPQVEILSPFAPMRRGPDDGLFDMCGNMLKEAPVSTKKFVLVFWSVRNNRPEPCEKDIAVAVAGSALEKKSWPPFESPLEVVRWRPGRFPSRHRGVCSECSYYRTVCD